MNRRIYIDFILYLVYMHAVIAMLQVSLVYILTELIGSNFNQSNLSEIEGFVSVSFLIDNDFAIFFIRRFHWQVVS